MKCLVYLALWVLGVVMLPVWIIVAISLLLTNLVCWPVEHLLHIEGHS